MTEIFLFNEAAASNMNDPTIGSVRIIPCVDESARTEDALAVSGYRRTNAMESRIPPSLKNKRTNPITFVRMRASELHRGSRRSTR